MKKFENMKIDEQELTKVSGGTVGEMWDLTKKILQVQPGALSGFKYAAQVAEFLQGNVPGGKLTGPLNCALAAAVESYMNKSYGVKTHVSVGFLGTGWGDEANTYSYGGKRINHQEAMSRIV